VTAVAKSSLSITSQLWSIKGSLKNRRVGSKGFWPTITNATRSIPIESNCQTDNAARLRSSRFRKYGIASLLVRLWGRGGGPAQTLFEQIAALMNCFPEFIDLARFKPTGLLQIPVDWEIRRLRASHGTVSKSESSDCTRDRPPEWGSIREIVQETSKLSSRNTHLYLLHRTVRLGLHLCFRARSSHAYPQ